MQVTKGGAKLQSIIHETWSTVSTITANRSALRSYMWVFCFMIGKPSEQSDYEVHVTIWTLHGIQQSLITHAQHLHWWMDRLIMGCS